MDLAASGLTRVVGSVGGLYDGSVALGLSGGKDSRVIAAALLSAGVLPTFNTNITTKAEGETAVELLDLAEHALNLSLLGLDRRGVRQRRRSCGQRGRH